MIKHLACQMDGNRRWARSRGLQSFLGHKEGVEAVKRVVKFCLEAGIPYLSLYTFSLENFKRTVEEKNYLFGLFEQMFSQSIEEFIKQGIRVRFIGQRDAFPASIATLCEQLEQKTAHLNKLNLNFLFCYGSRQEIVSAAKQLMQKVVDGVLSPDQVTEADFQACLWTRDIPDPDLIIRTGNVVRLSNFLLFQSAYSEYCFLDCLWPDITKEHLQQAVSNFADRQRNFGA